MTCLRINQLAHAKSHAHYMLMCAHYDLIKLAYAYVCAIWLNNLARLRYATVLISGLNWFISWHWVVSNWYYMFAKWYDSYADL